MSSASTSGIPFKEDEDHSDQKKHYWLEEPLSIATEPKRQKEFDNEDGIYALAESIKAVYYQEYKMTSLSRRQGNENKEEEEEEEEEAILDDSHFDYII
jgi:hypothetical protein